MSLAKINNVLLVLIIILCGYVILAPFVPSLLFKLESRGHKKQQLESIISIGRSAANNQSSNNQVKGNSVVIPSMLLNQPVLEGTVGQQYNILNQGIWRWPLGSTPDKGGNTVLIGHRFTYTVPKGVFYYLNKLALGDEIGIFWNKHEYVYQVSKVSIVSPNDTAIEQNTVKPELTLFTCTPLWLPKDRLVIVANLEKSL